MKITLGYACICTILEGITTSSSYKYTDFLKSNDLSKLDKIITSNLENLIKILTFSQKNNIHFYRISSNLIPLATHNKVIFDYLDKYKNYYNTISQIINQYQIRVDMHSSTYCILNSTKQEVVNNTLEILKYHYNLQSYMNISNKTITIHIGSNTFGKKNSLTRFINNYHKLPKYPKSAIAIENDDKIFTIDDCLYLSQKLKLRVVLDYHHFQCNNTGKDITTYLDKVFATRQNQTPKVHFSSPKNKKEYRTHNNYIDPLEFMKFLKTLKKTQIPKLDIMLEAKAKDEALFRLTRYLKYKTNYIFDSETTFQI